MNFFKLARSGGPMHHVNSCSGGIARSSLPRAYWIERAIPSFGSVSVPSRSKKIAVILANALVEYGRLCRRVIPNLANMRRTMRVVRHLRNGSTELYSPIRVPVNYTKRFDL